MSQPTVRDMVRSIQRELRAGAITPDMARESLVQLTSLYGNVLDELREAEAAYKIVLLGHLSMEAKANRARMHAEASPEYGRWREASDVKHLVVEMVRSCKAYMRSLEEELRLAR